MIPSDLASRLRAMLETSVQPLSAVHEISSDLPTYEPGRRITATMLNSLPDGTFRALVAGRPVTLALPHAARDGDVLELVVTAQKGSMLFARTDMSATTAGSDRPRAMLSQTGQLISQVLTGRFGEVEPVPLGAGKALLPNAPASASDLVPALQEAVSKSGLFYEAHLRQWLEGNLTLEALKREPQALLGANPPVDAREPLADTAVAFGRNSRGELVSSDAAGRPNTLMANRSTDADASTPTGSPTANVGAGERAPSTDGAQIRKLGESPVPERLMPVIHQQLEALATQQMSWQGQIWPGMNVHWEVLNPEQQSPTDDLDAQQPTWRSNLRLDLPQLGGVQALLVLDAQGLSLRIDSDNSASADRMRAALTQLAEAVEAAGIKVASAGVTDHASA